MQIRTDEISSIIRQQIESLTHVVQDMEKETLEQEAIAWRLKAVELGLRRLREAA